MTELERALEIVRAVQETLPGTEKDNVMKMFRTVMENGPEQRRLAREVLKVLEPYPKLTKELIGLCPLFGVLRSANGEEKGARSPHKPPLANGEEKGARSPRKPPLSPALPTVRGKKKCASRQAKADSKKEIVTDKNHHEVVLRDCEDDQYEFDMKIEMLKSVINWIQGGDVKEIERKESLILHRLSMAFGVGKREIEEHIRGMDPRQVYDHLVHRLQRLKDMKEKRSKLWKEVYKNHHEGAIKGCADKRCEKQCKTMRMQLATRPAELEGISPIQTSGPAEVPVAEVPKEVVTQKSRMFLRRNLPSEEKKAELRQKFQNSEHTRPKGFSGLMGTNNHLKPIELKSS